MTDGPRAETVIASTGRPANNALKLTKPAKERAPRHSAVQDGAPCRVAGSSLMWASQLNAVFSVPTAMNVEVERAPLTVGASSWQQHWGAGVEGCGSVLVERASRRPVAVALSA